MKTNVFILICGMLIIPSAGAVTTMGNDSCGNWISYRADKNTIELINRGWLHGYLSGVASVSNKDILKGVDSESVALWMDNYCRTNPLDNLVKGGNMLAIELMQRSDNKAGK